MVSKLIDENKIEIYFQPIMSIKDKRIYALEALTRAFNEKGEIISPIFLFKQAIKENIVNTLDAYVRKLALKKFIDYHQEDKSILLFLNFESTFVESEQYDTFLEDVKQYNINPANIVLEIKEDEIKNNNYITRFVDLYRKNKFIIAVDDFGIGYSSFHRLSLIKPDIVKIDRSLIYNVNKNYINSEILRAISNMCNKIGAVILAEGVESKNEILNCMSKDIDIFQGFYFSKPLFSIDISNQNSVYPLMQKIGVSHKKHVSKRILNKKRIFIKTQKLCRKIEKIYQKHKYNYKHKIKEILLSHKKLEAIYTINYDTGIQKNNTIIKIKKNTLFSPTKNSHDHSLKEYYFVAKRSSRSNYLSGSYVSKASGNMCRTYSEIITIDDEKYILCLDIKTS